MLNNYKLIIDKCLKIYVKKFIKLTVCRAVKFEKDCKINNVKLKAGNPRSRDLKNEKTCVIYNNRVLNNRESKKLNQIISDINENYEKKILIIEQIKDIVKTDKFTINIKKNLAKHYHITVAQLKRLFNVEDIPQIDYDNNMDKDQVYEEDELEDIDYIEDIEDVMEDEDYDLYDSC